MTPLLRLRPLAGRWLLVVALVAGLAGCADASGAPPTQAPASPTAPATRAPASTPATVPSPTPSPVAAPPATPPPAATVSVPLGVAMPRPALTPGEVFPDATPAQVCVSGYSGRVRHVTLEQYHEVDAAYGIPYPQPSGTYELDHLIPLEIGGDNANANLWPEPASVPGFHQKDQLENALHDLVCSGRLDLHEAQREVATDWYAAYERYVVG